MVNKDLPYLSHLSNQVYHSGPMVCHYRHHRLITTVRGLLHLHRHLQWMVHLPSNHIVALYLHFPSPEVDQAFTDNQGLFQDRATHHLNNNSKEEWDGATRTQGAVSMEASSTETGVEAEEEGDVEDGGDTKGGCNEYSRVRWDDMTTAMLQVQSSAKGLKIDEPSLRCKP